MGERVKISEKVHNPYELLHHRITRIPVACGVNAELKERIKSKARFSYNL